MIVHCSVFNTHGASLTFIERSLKLGDYAKIYIISQCQKKEKIITKIEFIYIKKNISLSTRMITFVLFD